MFSPPVWSPQLWNLSEQNTETLLSSASAWIQALAVVRTEEAELAEFEATFRQVCRSLDQFQQRERLRALELLNFVLSWITRRRPKTEVQRLRQALRESLTNTTTLQEVEEMASKLGPTIEDVARSEAELRTTRSNLSKVLQVRFGTMPTTILDAINTCQDLGRLDAWLEQAVRIPSLADFRPE